MRDGVVDYLCVDLCLFVVNRCRLVVWGSGPFLHVLVLISVRRGSSAARRWGSEFVCVGGYVCLL